MFLRLWGRGFLGASIQEGTQMDQYATTFCLTPRAEELL